MAPSDTVAGSEVVVQGSDDEGGDGFSLPSTAGYASQAERLLERYDAYDSAQIYPWLVARLPEARAPVIDIGSGSGRDAAWLAGLGYRVVAVEPVTQMRQGAMRLHPDEGIEWVDDHLPSLLMVRQRGPFDLILLGAVWMHLDRQEREEGMATLATLARPGTCLAMTLRHGPVPMGRRMFAVEDEETTTLAERCGFRRLELAQSPAHGRAQQADGVWFSALGFTYER